MFWLWVLITCKIYSYQESLQKTYFILDNWTFLFPVSKTWKLTNWLSVFIIKVLQIRGLTKYAHYTITTNTKELSQARTRIAYDKVSPSSDRLWQVQEQLSVLHHTRTLISPLQPWYQMKAEDIQSMLCTLL